MTRSVVIVIYIHKQKKLRKFGLTLTLSSFITKIWEEFDRSMET